MGIEVNSSVSHETEARSSEYTFILFAKQHNDGLEFLVQKEKKSGNFKPIGGAKMLLDVNFEAAALRELKEEAEFYPDPTALISLKDVFFDKQNEDGSLSREQGHMVPFAYYVNDAFYLQPTEEEREVGEFIWVTPKEFSQNSRFQSYVGSMPIWTQQIEDHIKNAEIIQPYLTIDFTDLPGIAEKDKQRIQESDWRIINYLNSIDVAYLEKELRRKIATLLNKELVETAIELIKEYQPEKKLRGDGYTPYLAHLFQVALISDLMQLHSSLVPEYSDWALPDSEKAEGFTVRLLHDIREDTNIDSFSLREIVGAKNHSRINWLSTKTRWNVGKTQQTHYIDEPTYYDIVFMAIFENFLITTKIIDNITNLHSFRREPSKDKKNMYIDI